MSRGGQGKHREGERGFALLLVFVLAAAVALMLYRQMPRVAFESERDKEQLLIDRGAQYQRAIQLYFVTFKRYPARIEDLENTNDHRFLRKRYLDPYTGKAEWRLVHTNGLTLTDSKVQPPPNPNGNGNGTGAGSSTAGTSPGTGTNAGGFSNSTSTQTSSNTSSTDGTQAAPPAVNSTVAARPSDRSLPTNASYNASSAGVYNQAAQNNQPYAPPNYNDPAQFPPISLYPNGYNANQPGQPGNGVPNQPGMNQPGFNPNQPGFNQPGFNQPGLNQPGVNPNQPGAFIPPTLPPGLTTPGLPAGMSMPGLPAGLNQPGLNQPGLNQNGFNQPTNPVATSPDGSQQVQVPQQFPGQQPVQPTFPQQGFPQQGLPQQAPVQQQPGQYIPPANNPSLPGAPGAANPGLNIINQLLTTPRPAPAGIGAATNNQTVGGGIAGVASTFSGGTIKSYGGRMDYSEWEFVYQLPQQQGLPANVPGSQTPNGAPQNTPAFPGGGLGGMPPLGSPPGPAPTSIPSPPAGGFPAVPSLPPH